MIAINIQTPEMTETATVATMKIGQLAELLELSDRRIRQLADEGYLPRPRDGGRLPLWESIRGYIRFLKSRKGKSESADTDGELLDKDQEQAKSAREDWIRKQRERKDDYP